MPQRTIVDSDRASYNIICVTENTVVDPGDNLRIDFYITGSGPDPVSKLYINYAALQLDSSDPGEISTSVRLQPVDDIDEEEIRSQIPEDAEVVFRGGSEVESTRKIEPEETGFIHPTGPFFFSNKDVNWGFSYPPIHSEVSYDGSAPISLSLNLADDVPPGDYDIISVLTYGNEVITKQSQAVQKIHVNSWVERHRFSLVVIGLISTLLALAIDIPVTDLPFVQNILMS